MGETPTFQAKRLGTPGEVGSFVSLDINTDGTEISFFIDEDDISLFEVKERLTDLLDQIEELIK
jgi:hypothetical protein